MAITIRPPFLTDFIAESVASIDGAKTITAEQIKLIEKTCEEILKDKGVRFVGVINRMGRLVVGKHNPSIKSHLLDNEDKMVYMQLAMEIFLRQEFDKKLGSIDYVLSKRKKVNMISIPIEKYLVLVSTEPGINVDDTFKDSVDRLAPVLRN